VRDGVDVDGVDAIAVGGEPTFAGGKRRPEVTGLQARAGGGDWIAFAQQALPLTRRLTTSLSPRTSDRRNPQRRATLSGRRAASGLSHVGLAEVTPRNSRNPRSVASTAMASGKCDVCEKHVM